MSTIESFMSIVSKTSFKIRYAACVAARETSSLDRVRGRLVWELRITVEESMETRG